MTFRRNKTSWTLSGLHLNKFVSNFFVLKGSSFQHTKTFVTASNWSNRYNLQCWYTLLVVLVVHKQCPKIQPQWLYLFHSKIIKKLLIKLSLLNSIKNNVKRLKIPGYNWSFYLFLTKLNFIIVSNHEFKWKKW